MDVEQLKKLLGDSDEIELDDIEIESDEIEFVIK